VERDGEFDNKQKYSIKDKRQCLRELNGAETWALVEKLEVILNSCIKRMLRYMARVRWQDRISSEEVAEKCGLKIIQDKLRQKRLQWFGHVRRETERGVLRLVEDMEALGKRKIGRPGKLGKI